MVKGEEGKGEREPAFDPDPRHDFEVIDVSSLSDREVRKLWQDIKGIVDDEMDGPLDLYFTPAEKVLLERIGGQTALRSYVDCLMVERKGGSR